MDVSASLNKSRNNFLFARERVPMYGFPKYYRDFVANRKCQNTHQRHRRSSLT